MRKACPTASLIFLLLGLVPKQVRELDEGVRVQSSGSHHSAPALAVPQGRVNASSASEGVQSQLHAAANAHHRQA